MDEQNSTTAVACGQCGAPIEEDPDLSPYRRQPCPRCGSTSRLFKVHISGQAVVHSTLGMKGREPGKKRPFLEAKVGDDLHRKTGKWNRIERIVDRRRNRYRERVVDPGTGEILRDADEPLTQHTEHGSAKKAKAPGAS